jgi:hypothetical protein
MESSSSKLKVVWGVTERGDRTHWARVGVAWENSDGSLSARLEAVPMSGMLCVRDWTPSTKSEPVQEEKVSS